MAKKKQKNQQTGQQSPSADPKEPESLSLYQKDGNHQDGGEEKPEKSHGRRVHPHILQQRAKEPDRAPQAAGGKYH